MKHFILVDNTYIKIDKIDSISCGFSDHQKSYYVTVDFGSEYRTEYFDTEKEAETRQNDLLKEIDKYLDMQKKVYFSTEVPINKPKYRIG